MLQKPSDTVLEALASLKGDIRFDVVLEWLQEEQANLDSKMALQTDEIALRWKQGASQSLRDVLEYAINSRDILRARKSTPQRTTGPTTPYRNDAVADSKGHR